MGEWPNKEGIMASWADRARNDVGFQRHLIKQNDEFIGEKIRNMKVDVQTLEKGVESKLQSLS